MYVQRQCKHVDLQLTLSPKAQDNNLRYKVRAKEYMYNNYQYFMAAMVVSVCLFRIYLYQIQPSKC